MKNRTFFSMLRECSDGIYRGQIGSDGVKARKMADFPNFEDMGKNFIFVLCVIHSHNVFTI